MPARGYLRSRWDRLNGPARIGGIDLARGLAVIGMLAAHLLTTAPMWVWTDPGTWTAIVDGRSSILFATLAGVSVGIVTGAGEPLPAVRMSVARTRLLTRAAVLFVVGLLLILTGVPVYVILPAYAILFLLAIPFTGLSAMPLLTTAGVLAVLLPILQPLWEEAPFWSTPEGVLMADVLGWHYPFTVWIVFVLAGLGLARAGLLRRAVQWRMLLGGAVLAIVGYALGEVPATSAYLAAVWTAEPHSSGMLEVIGSGGFAVAVIGLCLLLCRFRTVRMLVLPLRATGAMPLTAYTAQLLIWALTALIVLGDTGDLDGFRALDPFWPLTIGLLVCCTAWALLLGRGPLEAAMAWTARTFVPSPAPPAA